MLEAEDGKPSTDSFEVWDTYCTLTGAKPSTCSITAVGFVELDGVTHVSTWRHDAISVREVTPGVFRIEMNGRLSPYSGLSVIIRLDKAGREVDNIEGEITTGTRGQSRRTFRMDRLNPTRKLAPLWNPGFK